MSGSTVYLAGPITGQSFEESQDWRDHVVQLLSDQGIVAFSPLRAKRYIADEKVLKDSYDHHPLSTAKGIVTRDRHDATTCGVLLVNFLGSKRVSIGTVMEIAWADAHRIPIVICMKPDNIHNHSMVKEVAGYIVPELEAAVDIVVAILKP